MTQDYSFPHSSPMPPSEPESDTEGVKMTKDQVNYRPAGSSSTNCGSCGHYLGDGICEVVAGTVSTDAVSDEYIPRAGGLQDLVAG